MIRSSLFYYGVLIVVTACNLSYATEITLRDEDVLRQIEEQFSGIRTVYTEFTQEKKVALFNHTLKLKGWIVLDDQGRFAWHVQTPLKYSLIVKDGDILQWDEDTDDVQAISLSANPVLGIVFEQLSQWFSGRYRSLVEQYDINVLQDHPAVILFTPLEGSIERKMVKQVTIHFADQGDYLKQIDIVEVSGDTSSLHFSKTAINQPIDPVAWQPKF